MGCWKMNDEWMAFDLLVWCQFGQVMQLSLPTSRIVRRKASMRPPGMPRVGDVCSRTAPCTTATGYAMLNVIMVSMAARSKSTGLC